nr:cytosolic protein [candidate division Zixibacteria bacterium]
MECHKDRNLKSCNCSYEPCSRKGTCCDCISYHIRMRELPACCFNIEAERTYNRSFEYFARLVSEGKL